MNNEDKSKLIIPASSDRLIRISALISPLALIGYTYLVNTGVVSTHYRINQIGLNILLGSFVFAAIVQFFKSTTSKIDLTLRFSAYWIASGAYFMFFSVFTNPLIVLWVALIATCYSRLSTFGIQLSFFFVISTVIVDAIFWNQNNVVQVASNLIVVLGIVFSSTIITLMFHNYQKKSLHKLVESQDREAAQKDRVLTIINNMSDAVISTDLNGIINVENAACLDLLDTNKNLIGRKINEVLPLVDTNKKFVDIFDELKSSFTMSRRDDLIYSFSANDKIRLEITYAPIKKSFSKSENTEPIDGYILILRDITKQKSLDEERDDFLSVVSHELRTPITTAEGSISNLQFMIKLPNTTLQIMEKPINVAHDQIMFLANLVNDLSALSRAERNVGGEAEEIDVHKLAEGLIEKYKNDANKKDLKLKSVVSSDIKTINTSKLYIDELLQNLVSNAVKYTKKGSVTLIIEKKSDYVLFAVKDTGIGISKSDQEKIFGKFYRSEDYRTRETGGTGLGLFVAQQLAIKLNTIIECESELNVGSTFSFKLKK